MKKILIVAMMAVLPSFVFAQRIDKPGEPYEYFIQVEPISDLGGKYKAKIDLFNGKGREYLVDEKGEKMEFYSRSDVINYMTRRGWVFIDIIIANRIFDILFKKEVKSDEEAKLHIRTEKDK